MRNAKPQTSHAALGLCYILPSTSTTQRGSLCAQQYMYHCIGGVPVPCMNLHDVLITPYSIVLDLDTIYLQVSRGCKICSFPLPVPSTHSPLSLISFPVCKFNRRKSNLSNKMPALLEQRKLKPR